jgi:small-conductance mechanosensitive channel
MISNFRKSLAAGAMLCLVAAAVGLAQDPPSGQDLKNAVDDAVTTRQETQQQKNQWAEEKAELTRRYRAAQSSVDWLTERRAAETARAEALEQVVAELERRLAEADRLEGSIQDTLMVLQGRLVRSVEQGLPFLADERRQRLDLVAAELARPDVDSAEKLRRLLEALQIEAGFASSIEVYQDEITVADQLMYADILRMGRLALFWRTPDGSRVGHFDQAAGQWTELPGSQKRNIGLAMEMATRMRPFEVIDLPLGRIAP